MVMHAHVPKVSANKAYRKNCLLEFPIATISLIGCYLLNFEHGTEHDIDSAYGVCMH